MFTQDYQPRERTPGELEFHAHCLNLFEFRPEEEKTNGDPLAVTKWEDFRGQTKAKRTLRLFINSAKTNNTRLGHVLLSAPPGLGKTTLAHIIASQMGTNLHLMELPMEGKEMLHRISMMQDKDVCLLDEAHLISQRRGAVETLLPILIGGKDSAGNRVPDVTFVAATTDKDKLPVAFLDRLPIQPYFETYTVAQMRDIIEGMCEKKSINLDAATVHGLALAANGTPRTAGTLVTHAQVLLENGESATTKSVLSLANMTPDGLSREHVNYLRTMYKNPKHVSGETVYRMGFSSIVSIMREPKETVARLERLLIDLNYIVPDTGGRCLTAKGIDFARKGF